MRAAAKRLAPPPASLRLRDRLADLPLCDAETVAVQPSWWQAIGHFGSARNRTGLTPPPFLDALLAGMPRRGWGIGYETAAALSAVFGEVNPALVLEFGSGTSTVVFAALAQTTGTCRVVSLDESEDFAERTRARLARHGLQRCAEVLVAPVVWRRLDGWEGFNYAPPAAQIEDALAGVRADLVFIDGPATWFKRRGDCRFGTLLAARAWAADPAVFVADDVSRRRDLAIFRRWATLPGVTPLGVIRADHGLGIGLVRP